MDFSSEKLNLSGGIASVPLAALSQDEFMRAWEEAKPIAEQRGLWIPENAGKIVVAQEVDLDALRTELLGTVVEGATLYNGAIKEINSGRSRGKRIATTEPGVYRDIAEDWLTAPILKAATELPKTANRPLLVVPRLGAGAELSTEEVVKSWQAAAGGKLWKWDGRMEFLKNWTANQLSGFNPAEEGKNLLGIIPTAYDKAREGNVGQQVTNFGLLKDRHPNLEVAPIFAGVPLGRRYLNKNREWQDSLVVDITLKPAKVGEVGCVPDAGVYGGGRAFVGPSRVGFGLAARLQVR